MKPCNFGEINQALKPNIDIDQRCICNYLELNLWKVDKMNKTHVCIRNLRVNLGD